MRSTRIVMTMLAALFFSVAGCGQQEQDHGAGLGLISGCRAANHSEKALVDKIALPYFKREVGIATSSVKIGTTSSCEKKLLVPIEARTSNSPFAQAWLVEIDKHDPSKIELIRPE